MADVHNIMVVSCDAGVVEVPAVAISILFLLKMGRRWPLCLTLVGSGVACLLTLTIPPGTISDCHCTFSSCTIRQISKYVLGINYSSNKTLFNSILPKVSSDLNIFVNSIFVTVITKCFNFVLHSGDET
jgi:hypothetical protein